MDKEEYNEDYNEAQATTRLIWAWAWRITSMVMVISLTCMWGCPNYNVYQQNLEGEAELARATQNRQIKIQEAQATKEAAKDLAEAEVIRAGGVARANTIIGSSLKGNEAYLHYLFINNLEHTKDQIIYLPTEAGLPILEAGRGKK